MNLADKLDIYGARIGAIGDVPGLSDEERLKRRFLIYMGVLMSGGGILWGSICAYLGIWAPAIVPYGYVVLTAINLTRFKYTKDWETTRFLQVLTSLLLPFFFQWALGGFVASGGVMLWSMLALVGSLTFSSARQSLGLLFLYSVLTVVSGAIDGLVRQSSPVHPTDDITVAFLVTNFVVITSIVFSLTLYLMVRRENANEALQHANKTITAMNAGLEALVEARTQQLSDTVAERQAILDHLTEGLVAVGAEAKVQVANPTLAELFGQQMPGTGDSLESLPDGLRDAISEAGSSSTLVTRDIALPGDRVGVVSAAPIGQNLGVVALVRDATLEREIDRMKTDFIATVSHELRTPLTSVLGFAKVTKGRLEDRVAGSIPEDDKKAQRAMDQALSNVDIIIHEGKRLTALINDVLDISKMEAGRMEWRFAPFDVAEMLNRAVEITTPHFPEDGKVRLISDISEKLPRIVGDENRIVQVLLNLLSNAAKFTAEGRVTVRARPLNSGVLIEVIDTGDGIEPALRTAVFEKFKQVGDTLTDKPHGTGLGLPICKQIVLAHGGSIEVDGALGIGSIFRVHLPAHPPKGMLTPT